MADVVLIYERNGHVFDGYVALVEGDEEKQRVPLCGATYGALITQVSRMLRASEGEVGVVIHRTDRLGLSPFRLDETLVSVIKNDPVEYIRGTTFDATPVGIVHPNNRPSVTSSQLAVGYDVLASSFGDVVYIRRNMYDEPNAECPVCGSWVPFYDDSRLINCCDCGFYAKVEDQSKKWVGVRTEDLLSCGSGTFFLPNKEWNGFRNLISRDELAAKYAAYLKEKENVRSEAR